MSITFCSYNKNFLKRFSTENSTRSLQKKKNKSAIYNHFIREFYHPKIHRDVYKCLCNELLTSPSNLLYPLLMKKKNRKWKKKNILRPSKNTPVKLKIKKYFTASIKVTPTVKII